jgi:hypothetical protein
MNQTELAEQNADAILCECRENVENGVWDDFEISHNGSYWRITIEYEDNYFKGLQPQFNEAYQEAHFAWHEYKLTGESP